MTKAAGVSRQSMHGFIKQDSNSEPKFSHIQRLGQSYGIDMNWLFYGTGDMLLQDATPVKGGQLRLVPSRNDDGSQPADLPELKIKAHGDAESYDAQLRLLDKVCEVMTLNGASQDMINKAALAIVAGTS